MNDLQQELDAEHPALGIHLLGVNGEGHESGLALMSDGGDIPLLQDTRAVDAWNTWDVTYRDVIVLDRQNRVFGVFNLTEHDLAVSQNYAALKQMFIDAATQ